MLRILSIIALMLYLLHGVGYHLCHGTPHHALWFCHLSLVLLGIGLMFRRVRLVNIAFLWSVAGIVFWGIELATTGETSLTSVLSHIGAVAISTAGVVTFGFQRGSWLWALAAAGLLQMITRFVTPPAANVNLSHRVWDGWEPLFPSYPLYVLSLYAVVGFGFFVAETVVRRWRPHESL